MKRRTFLGAAAALEFLSTASPASGAEVAGVTEDQNLGAGSAKLDTGEPVWSVLEIQQVPDEEATISLEGYWYDDEPPQVEVRINSGPASHVLNMGTERARDLAADLEKAADQAERRSRMMGGRDA